MKKTLSILLILLLVFNSCGFIFVYYQALFVIRQLASKEISNPYLRKDIQIITIKSDSHIAAFIEEKEFRMDHKMYDIVRTVRDNDLIHIYCYQDHKEEILNKVFNNQVDEQSPVASGLKNLVKLLQLDGLPIAPLSNSEFFQPVLYSCKAKLSFQDTYKEVLLPPPLFI